MRFKNGKRILTKRVLKGYFPAVIDKKTWGRLQEFHSSNSLKKGRTGRNVPNLFQGIAFSLGDENGRTSSMVLKRNKSGVSFVPSCGGKGWNYDYFEQCVLKLVCPKFLKSRHDPAVRVRIREFLRKNIRRIFIPPASSEINHPIFEDGSSVSLKPEDFFTYRLKKVKFPAGTRKTKVTIYRQFHIAFHNNKALWVIISQDGKAKLRAKDRETVDDLPTFFGGEDRFYSMTFPPYPQRSFLKDSKGRFKKHA